jgi:hypothetical protein
VRTFPPAMFWVVLLTLGLAACQPAAEEGEEADAADTMAMEEGAAPDAASAEASYTLVVSNPMPHAMNVTATLPDGSQIQLGSVPASGESSFSVTGTAGEVVTVTATDEAATHAPTGSVTLPAGETTVSWTVQ